MQLAFGILVLYLMAWTGLLDAHQVLELESNTFEVTLTAFQYLAILFYDLTEKGQLLESNWEKAANLLGDSIPDGAQMAKVRKRLYICYCKLHVYSYWNRFAITLNQILASDSDLKEIIEAYGISVPSVLIFRKGALADYRGPYDSKGIAQYIAEDVKVSIVVSLFNVAIAYGANLCILSLQPSISFLDSLETVKSVLSQSSTAVVLGFFRSEDINLESEDSERAALENWGQFHSAADSLRGYVASPQISLIITNIFCVCSIRNVKFYAISAASLLETFNLKEAELPTVYLFSSENEGLSRYTGPLVDTSLTDWILRNIAPPLGELTLSTPAAQQYAAQFFSSRKLKFILFLPDQLPADIITTSDSTSLEDDEGTAFTRDDVLLAWELIANNFHGRAIFSYMSTNTPIADVVDYFDVNLDTEAPLVAAHNPTVDGRYKSPRMNLARDIHRLQEYVEGVVSGRISKILRSEPRPKTQRSLVFRTVGDTVIETVSRGETDVLLVVYSSHQSQSKQIMPHLEMLARAVQGESRILVAKIDASLNDLPPTWVIKNFPALLWFPARDKPYAGQQSERRSDGTEGDEYPVTPIPRPYWDAGYSLQELFSFVQRESSFDKNSLRIATSEQLGSLQQDEDMYRAKFEEEDRHDRRNEGREIYAHDWADYFLGEVVFDGKRWHVALVALLGIWSGLASLLCLAQMSTSRRVSASNVSGNKRAKRS